FFDKQGGARSSAEVYRVLVAKHDGTTTPAMAVAAVPAAPVPTASAPVNATAVAPVAAPSIVGAPAATVAPPPETGPKLGSLFSKGGRGAVPPSVQERGGASAPGRVQRAVPAGLFEPAAAQPSAAQLTTPAAVSPTASAGRPSPEPFNFLRPVAPNQGAW